MKKSPSIFQKESPGNGTPTHEDIPEHNHKNNEDGPVKEKKRGRVLRWIAGVFVVLFFLLFLAEWILEREIRKLIESREVEIAGRTYVPQVGDVKLSLLTLSVVLQDIGLKEKAPGDFSRPDAGNALFRKKDKSPSVQSAIIPADTSACGTGFSADTIPDSLADITGNMPGAEIMPVSASVQTVAIKGVRIGKKDGKYRVRIRNILVRSPYAFLDTGEGAAGKNRVETLQEKENGTAFHTDPMRRAQLRLAGELRREGRQKDSLLRARDAGKRKSLRDRIASLQINNIEVENGNIQYAGRKDGERVSYSLSGLNFRGDDLTVPGNSPLWGNNAAAAHKGPARADKVPSGKSSEADSGRKDGRGNGAVPGGEWFTAEDMSFSFDKFRSRYHYGAMVLEADSLRIGFRDSVFSVSAIRLLPQYGEYEYAKKVKDHTDWTRVTAGPVKAAGVDFDRFLAERVLYMDSLSVWEADVRSYKNRQVYQKPKIKPLSWISLHHLPFKIKIPTVILGKIDVTYEELSAKGLSPGKITITGIEGKAKGLTNIPSGNGEKTYYSLDAAGYLMGKGLLKAHFRLPADSLNTHFEVTGSLGEMDLTELNRMILPLANLKVRSGVCNGVNFAVSANSVKSHVDMTFLYDDLKVELFKEKKGGLVKRGFLSGVVNLIAIHTRNPNGRRIRTGEGSFERDPYKSQFNYLWKSLFPGIKDTVLAI